MPSSTMIRDVRSVAVVTNDGQTWAEVTEWHNAGGAYVVVDTTAAWPRVSVSMPVEMAAVLRDALTAWLGEDEDSVAAPRRRP